MALGYRGLRGAEVPRAVMLARCETAVAAVPPGERLAIGHLGLQHATDQNRVIPALQHLMALSYSARDEDLTIHGVIGDLAAKLG